MSSVDFDAILSIEGGGDIDLHLGEHGQQDLATNRICAKPN